MPNKTISVKDLRTWNKAAAIVKREGRSGPGSMSGLIEKLLAEKIAEIDAAKRASIAAMEAAAGGPWEAEKGGE